MYAHHHKTLYEAFFSRRNVFLDAYMLLLSVVFLAVMANIQIPLWPVPITMQTFGVLSIAFFFGARKGALSLLLYALAGLFGFGVFAGYKSGLAILIGPTGGYIAGFVIAGFMVGYLIEKGWGRTYLSVLGCALIGEAIIYALGLPVLYLNFPENGISWTIKYGFTLFIIGDALKMLGAVSLFPFLWKGSERISRSR